MLNQFKEQIETYPEEDGKTHCTLCGACVEGLESHMCSNAQLKHDASRRPIHPGPYDHLVDEMEDILHRRQY